MKRSPKRMANCAFAEDHSLAGMVHSFSERFKTRKRSLRAASSVCNHSWSHDERMQLRSAASVRAELERTSRAIAPAAGRPPRYYRAPGGNWAPSAVAEADRQHLRLLGWSVDPYDWRRPPTAEITRRVLAGAAPGAIVLMHDGYSTPTAVAPLRTLLTALAAQAPALQAHPDRRAEPHAASPELSVPSS